MVFLSTWFLLLLYVLGSLSAFHFCVLFILNAIYFVKFVYSDHTRLLNSDIFIVQHFYNCLFHETNAIWSNLQVLSRVRSFIPSHKVFVI